MSFLRSLFVLIVGVVLAVFIGVNWEPMSTPTDLSLVFTQVHAPLGLILLGFMVLLAVLFIGWAAYMQGLALIERRGHAKELAAQRALADKAEASRLTELRAHVDEEVTRITEAITAQGRETMSRIDRAEMGLRERPVDAEVSHLVQSVDGFNRDFHSRIDRLEIGLRERPLDGQITRLIQAIDNYDRDVHSRVDRLESGLRDGLVGYTPAPASVQAPAVQRPQPDDPGVRDSDPSKP